MKNKSLHLIFCLLFFSTITFISCEKNDSSEGDFSIKIKQLLETNLAQDEVAGAAIYAKNATGELAWHAAGVMDKESNNEMLKNAKFRIASISKPFLAVVVLQLMEEEVLSLNDHYADYLHDSVVSLFPYGNEVTIYQLLNHTSGIYDFEDDEFLFALANDLTYKWTPYELLLHAKNASESEFFPPNTETHYSNTNYILLGLVVESITGKTLEQNIRDRILDPLGLENTFSWEEGVPQQNYPTGYQAMPDGSTLVVNDQTVPMYFEWAHGHMVSTVEELYIFFSALLSGQLFQNSSTLDIMLSWSPLSDFTTGLGIFNFSQGLGYGHTGGTVGFFSVIAVNPHTGTAISLCFNESSSDFLSNMINGFKEIIDDASF